jgi:hypothetical protein
MYRVGHFTAVALYGTSLVVYAAQEAGLTDTGRADLPPAVVPAASGATISMITAAGLHGPLAIIATDAVLGEARVAPQTGALNSGSVIDVV